MNKKHITWLPKEIRIVPNGNNIERRVTIPIFIGGAVIVIH
jgi:hypothetical protein